jgi:CTP synthase
MNPYVHGEVFVLDDGWEADMDIGTYERFLNLDLTKEHNITTGQIYHKVIEEERRGTYLGQCVQIIPHITEEIKRRIRNTVQRAKTDIAIIECGGTVGDIEGLPFLEAFRQMRLEEPRENTASVHITLVPKLKTVGEQKTKPTQHSVQELRRIGIQPDIIAARSGDPLTSAARKKISLFANVPEQCVFSLPDTDEIYAVPNMLERQGFSSVILKILGLGGPRIQDGWEGWNRVVEGFTSPTNSVTIAIGGKYVALSDSYVSVKEAIRHAAAASGTKARILFLDTERVEKDHGELRKLDKVDGIIIPGGFGARGAEGKIMMGEYAMKNAIPHLGLCFGFQLALVMFARSVLGMKGANTTEIDPDTPYPVIHLLPQQAGIERMGGTMRLGGYDIILEEGSLAHSLYKSTVIRRRHRHRYIPNPKYLEDFKKAGLHLSGRSSIGGHIEVIELPGHPFFFATQYHPEFTSRPESPDGAYVGLIKAALQRRNSKGG